jgi:phage tail sheath gpL-like
MLPPTTADHLVNSERNQLLAAGVSTFDVVADEVMLERLVTGYKLDAQGQPDKKFHDITTMRCIHAYRRQWRAATMKYRQYKLVDDGTPIRPGVKALTPSMGKAIMDSFYEAFAETGNAQQVANFIAKSRCERDATDRNRLNFYHPCRFSDIVVTLATRIEVQ